MTRLLIQTLDCNLTRDLVGCDSGPCLRAVISEEVCCKHLFQKPTRDRSSGEPTPEAPRTILDVLGTLDTLPLHIQARGEFEYVGAKPLGDGFTGVPVKEFRFALLRPFADGRMSLANCD